MTSNQIAYKQAQETERSNRAKEKLTKRGQDQQHRRELIKSGVDVAKMVLQNDPSWYNLDKQIVKDVANLSFNNPLGYPYKDILQNGVLDNSKVAPGICVLQWIPTIGGSSTIGDIADIAAKNIYAYVRHANSGSRNYEASDLMMYLLAIDQAYSFHAFMRKIYSLALTSKSHNRYYLDLMLKSHGMDPEDVRNNLSNFRAFINSYATRMNSFYAPKSMPLYQRHYWMNTGIYQDSPVKKSQTYVFLQDSFGEYDDINGKIKFLQGRFTPYTRRTVSYLFTLGNSIIQGLINSEDAGIMSGDILKAYGEGNMLFLENTPEDFHIESVYSPEVLSQITNAVMVGDVISSYDIQQDPTTSKIYQGETLTQSSSAQTSTPGALNSNIRGILVNLGVGNNSAFKGTNNSYLDVEFQNWVLNFYKDDVQPDEAMVATRLTSLPLLTAPTTTDPIPGYRAKADQAATADTKWGRVMRYYGTELTTVLWYVCASATDATSAGPTGAGVITYNPDSQYSSTYAGEILSLAAKFDWSPIIYVFRGDNTAGTINKITGSYGSSRDFANYTSINTTVLGNMHYAAVLSEFGVPLLGMTVRTR